MKQLKKAGIIITAGLVLAGTMGMCTLEAGADMMQAVMAMSGNTSSLPEDASVEVRMTTVEELELEDGIYLMPAELSGGSGKTSIESPAEVIVKDGKAEVQIVFSSPNYDYMIVDGERYDYLNEEGNSMFLIPVSGFDYEMPVTADTVAMSEPHEIEYTIWLDSSDIQKK